ncbi:unnamed protein product [Bathycoccus prasinos]
MMFAIPPKKNKKSLPQILVVPDSDADDDDDDDGGGPVVVHHKKPQKEDGGKVYNYKPLHDPCAPNALVLVTAEEARKKLDDESGFGREKNKVPCVSVVMDPNIARKLRKHQKEGVRWMYRKLFGFNDENNNNNNNSEISSRNSNSNTNIIENSGVLLADDMGLGKTLQVLALAWTVLKQTPFPTLKKPFKRILVTCPATLVGNWGNESKKWIGNVRAQCVTADGGAENVERAFQKWIETNENVEEKPMQSSFDRFPILIASYETMRKMALRIPNHARPDLLCCDEAHRLKSDSNQTVDALKAVNAKHRVLMTGTPIQNNLMEFAAILDVVQPRAKAIFGWNSLEEFKEMYERPIMEARASEANAEQKKRGKELEAQLRKVTKKRILRRKAELVLKEYLVPKTEYLMLCNMSGKQKRCYEAGSNYFKKNTNKNNNALSAIGILRQCANSAKHCLDAIGRSTMLDKTFSNTIRDAAEKKEEEDDEGEEECSGKLSALCLLLQSLKGINEKNRSVNNGNYQRVVIVSGYSDQLDDADKLCKREGLTTTRLDGSVDKDKRSEMVRNFNTGNVDVMLLSVRAGGAGLNLIGANCLILMDASWNPADDRQAMARVWRDGQQKPVFVYRLASLGTVEERVLLRQLGKESLLMEEKKEQEEKEEEEEEEFSLEKEEVGKLVEFKRNGHNEEWKDVRLRKQKHEALITNSLALMDCQSETRLVQCVVKASCTVHDDDDTNDDDDTDDGEREGENVEKKKKKKKNNFYVPPKKETTGNSAATKRVAFEDLMRATTTTVKKKKNNTHRKREKNKPWGGEDIPTAMEEKSSSPFSPKLLWDVIVNNDDICFTHILPRLNRTDLKFFYEVNTETRKLIKRSSRAGDLKWRFNIGEMSSISTLEVAWEKRWLWPSWWFRAEISFCIKVACTNKLELLKWAREEKKCEWDEKTFETVAEYGNLEMVKYCVASECPIDEMACALAAQNGHLECLKYLREEVKAPWDRETASCAARNGHLHILEYLVERKYDQYSEDPCWGAAKYGYLECLKYLCETAKAPWNYWAVRVAHKNNQTECVQYLLDNDCPLPDGWRYERGELAVSEEY